MRAIREPRERVMNRLVAHALLVAQARQRRGEDVLHRAHESHLLAVELALGREKQLVAGAEGQAHARLHRDP